MQRVAFRSGASYTASQATAKPEFKRDAKMRSKGGTVSEKYHFHSSVSLCGAAALAIASLNVISIGRVQAQNVALRHPTSSHGLQRSQNRDATSGGGTAVPALREVIVTAQRIRQPLQRVPIAISVIDHASLRRHDIQTLTDLQLLIPSAYVSGYSHGAGQQFFSLRGQSESGYETGGGVGGGPAVVGYFSGVPTDMAGPGLYYDLKSIQVLNGPQGTLFGRNTTGGAILFEPRRPDFRGMHGHVQVLGGDYRRAQIQGAVNIPLIGDELAMRVAGEVGSREGYTRDVNTGIKYDNRHFHAARLELLFHPSGRVQDFFIGSYVRFDQHGPGSILIAANPNNPFVGPAILTYLAAQNARGVRATALGLRQLDQETYYSLINKLTLKLTNRLKLKFASNQTAPIRVGNGRRSRALTLPLFRGANAYGSAVRFCPSGVT